VVCGLRFAVCGLRFAVCGLRFAVCGLRFVVCGVRKFAVRFRPTSLSHLLLQHIGPITSVAVISGDVTPLTHQTSRVIEPLVGLKCDCVCVCLNVIVCVLYVCGFKCDCMRAGCVAAGVGGGAGEQKGEQEMR